MYPYIANRIQDEELMLKTIGLESVEELFKDIPQSIKVKDGLKLQKSKSELEVTNELESMANRNKNLKELVCFLGAGVYDRYIPSIIKHIIGRSEFYTSYTPYQPEISQGILQAIFEYQTMIADLTGMDTANASMYDGATACSEAAMMAVDNTRRKKIIVSKTVHPEVRRVLATYMKVHEACLIEAEENEGVTDIDHLKGLIDKDTAGVIVQNPNFFGIVEDYSEIEKVTHENKALLIMNVEPIAMALLKTPGEIGADIAVGDGQSLGNSMSFGGPHLGFMAVSAKLMRKLPGRIVGQTVDVEGKRAFVLTLQAREQHIRREKASSNICSNHSLNALAAAVYMTTLGKQGIKEVAQQSMKKAHYAYKQLIKTGKYAPLFNKPFFMEFAVKSPVDISKLNEQLLTNGILGGYDLGRDYPRYRDGSLLCVTEKRTKSEIDNLVQIMEEIV
ncbi:aminomethyl-transferring glycine dehydrogenase subunit GcvPA [Clostridium thermarum]|uniref:aminomethyl-transferring glycine dehydrogenase subunit GcvPA n=1 Tax=Clostridium thermarum TaxID=1716543 RepID=UPI0013D4488A|nr:aminomethyl-transferring glycine dehydrogenase subunit GcvPA [Clostridium thermarum]